MGHLAANTDPLNVASPIPSGELELSNYGLSVWDLDRRFAVGPLGGQPAALPLRDIVSTLRQTYCRYIGVEYMHITDTQQRLWLQNRMESTRNHWAFSTAQQLSILAKLNAADAFERFLHTTYLGQKRFSLEGAETLIPMLDALLSDAAECGVVEAVIGSAHRGRLNVLANTIGKSSGAIFREFEGGLDPCSSHGSGDVKYHLGAVGKHVSPSGREIRLTMASNPSHLEAVNPVVEGMARARQDLLGDGDRKSVLPVLIHGDAAFAGQGVVAEVLNLSELKGYRTGGTIHIVVNNQIGFTTGPADARSSHYCTDVAKMVRAPVFHVNGDQPEDAVRVMQLALEFRQRFGRDVVVDLVCYRRWGHNEADDPSYTQPVLYDKIDKQRAVRKIYTESLLRRGDIDMEMAERALDHFRHQLATVHEEVRRAQTDATVQDSWTDREAIEGEAPALCQKTCIRSATITTILDGLDRTPETFEPHPKLAKQLSRRRDRVKDGKIDWALAETLAFGSVVLEGIAVRLSGEDSGRGTFSQRHAALYDHRTGAAYIPLAHLKERQGQFAVYDSLLSEYAVLGFDYGYSVAHPKTLVLWEAQFGDFANGAQVIIDQFICSAEDKWGQRNSLVMLLPHGYEGQGPEHSSARVERFLQLAARGNMQVCYPSTPAQYFHLLRRQCRLEARKPLVVFTPKSLLRLPAAVSTKQELTGGAFHEVIDDAQVQDPATIKRVVLCSGKVYYDLRVQRAEHPCDDIAVVRIEQLYPYPGERLAALFQNYKHAHDIVWVQEEPRNMGAWSFLDQRLQAKMAPGQRLRYVGRPPSPSPATGSNKRHVAEQQALTQHALSW